MEKKSEVTSPNSINALTDNISQLNLSFKIPYDQLKIGKLIGEGGFGSVYQATYLHADVAFKQLKSKKLGEQAQAEWLKETQVMAQLRSPFIVQLYGICTEPGSYGMIMEYLPKGSLFDLLQSSESLDWKVRYQIGLDAGKGITFLHAHKIIHRDLKSLNVLLDDRYRAKLCDFGLAKIKTLSSSTQTTSSVGTLAWMAPELFKRKAVYSEASDIYSYGMVLWEIASRRIPFEDAHGNQALIIEWVSKGEREEIPDEAPKPIKEAIESCWQGESAKRPTASQVIEQLQSGFETFQLQSLPKYPDNFASIKPPLSPNQAVISEPQYIDNFASSAEPIFLGNTGSSKSNLPKLELEDTPEKLVQVAQALIRGRPWTTAQKAYFQTLIETTSLPPIQTMTGHSSYVNCLLLLPSGEVVSGSFDKTLKMWDMKTGQCVKTLKGHSSYVNCLLLLPSGEVVSGSHDKTLKVWNMKTGQCMKMLEGHSDGVNRLLLLPSGEVLSDSSDKTLKVWDMKTGQCVKTLEGHSSWVNCLLLLPSGEVVSGSSDKTLKVWNMKTGQCVKTLEGHSSWVNCLLLLPSGEVVSGSSDKTLKVWNMKTGQCVNTLMGHTGSIKTLRLIPPNTLVSSTEGEIKRWNLSDYTCEHTYVGMQGVVYDLLPLATTECLLASGCTLERISWQPYDTLRQTLTQSPQSLIPTSYGFFKSSFKRQAKRLPRTLGNHYVTSFLLLPSGEVVSGSDDKTLKVWNMKTGECVKTLEGHSDQVVSLWLLPSGELVSSSSDKTLKVWNMKTGQCVKTLEGFSKYVRYLLLLPTGEVVSGSPIKKPLKVWNIKTGECVKTLEGHSDWVNCLLLLPSGEVVSGSQDKTLKVWDMKMGQCVKTLEGHNSSVDCLLLLPNGEVVSGSKDKTLKVWDMKTGECVKTLEGHSDWVNCLLLLPSGEVVSGSQDKTLKVWDMKTGQCVKTLVEHNGKVDYLLLLPSGEVVSGSEDNTLKVWDMKTGQCVKTLVGHRGEVTSLLLLPSGEVMSGSSYKMLRIWDIHLEKTLEELETQAPECKQM